MDTMVSFAQTFIGLFNTGGQTLAGWVTGIIPTLICLLVAMNALIKMIGGFFALWISLEGKYLRKLFDGVQGGPKKRSKKMVANLATILNPRRHVKS